VEIRWAPRASRDMDRLAEVAPRAVAAIVALVYGDLAREPARVGKPLRLELSGLYSARRREYRIVYRIDDQADVVRIERVALRRAVYRP
jgi:mRNA interferase RelE/StbE